MVAFSSLLSLFRTCRPAGRSSLILHTTVLSGLVTPVGRVGRGLLDYFKKGSGDKEGHSGILLIHDREVSTGLVMELIIHRSHNRLTRMCAVGQTD